MEKLTCWIPWQPWSRRTPEGGGPGCPPPATLPPPGPTSGQRPWPGCGRKLAAQWEVSYFRFWSMWFAQNSWEEMQRPLRTLIIWECYQNSKNGAVGNQLTDAGRVFTVQYVAIEGTETLERTHRLEIPNLSLASVVRVFFSLVFEVGSASPHLFLLFTLTVGYCLFTFFFKNVLHTPSITQWIRISSCRF